MFNVENIGGKFFDFVIKLINFKKKLEKKKLEKLKNQQKKKNLYFNMVKNSSVFCNMIF